MKIPMFDLTLRRFGLTLGLPLALVLAIGCLGIDYLRDIEPVHPDLTISAVIENPAQSREKWEVRASGRLVREEVDGRPIEIALAPSPVNDGMIPRTLLSSKRGGDDEPLDVLVFGTTRARGEVVRVRPVGLLQVIDSLERDDKILAVPATPDVISGIKSDVTSGSASPTDRVHPKRERER